MSSQGLKGGLKYFTVPIPLGHRINRHLPNKFLHEKGWDGWDGL